MATQQRNNPPSGTRDFLSRDVRQREVAFAAARDVFERYGFEPLNTPAYERIETLMGKYGDEGDKLIYKILRRGAHEASGEADLALRYDLTVPLARVVAAYGSQLPVPYKRYAIAPVWRADRPGKGRFREFTQCDIDIVGSDSTVADAECIAAIADALDALGVQEFRFLLNSRNALSRLLDAYDIPSELGNGTLITLDKLDKLAPSDVVSELESRGVDSRTAKGLVNDLTAEDAVPRLRKTLTANGSECSGLAEIDKVLDLLADSVGADRIAFTPRLVRGLDYYTGVIWEVEAPGFTGSIASGGRYDKLVASLGGPDVPACGGSIGIERIISQLDGESGAADSRLDVAVTVIDSEGVRELMSLTTSIRRAGLRTGMYLGSSGKLARQLKWADEQSARFTLIYGSEERIAGGVTVRDMTSGEQKSIPASDVPAYLRERVRDTSE